jgi:uncharacterized protein (TIGR02246 family)
MTTATHNPTLPTTWAHADADAEVRSVLAAHAAAHAAHDVERLLALYAPDAASYTLAPPLQQGPTTAYGSPEGVQAWFDTFAGPVELTYRDPVVATSDDIAFVHCLTRMTATSVGSNGSFSLWFRSTFGLRRTEGRWLIVHRHESTPFHMDGSFRAAVDLQP